MTGRPNGRKALVLDVVAEPPGRRGACRKPSPPRLDRRCKRPSCRRPSRPASRCGASAARTLAPSPAGRPRLRRGCIPIRVLERCWSACRCWPPGPTRSGRGLGGRAATRRRSRLGLFAAAPPAADVSVVAAVCGMLRTSGLGAAYAPLAAGAVVAFGSGTSSLSSSTWMTLPFFPGPDAVLGALVEDRALLFESTWHSLLLLLTGYTAGATAGLVCGVLIGWFTRVRYWGMPILRIFGPRAGHRPDPAGDDAVLAGLRVRGRADRLRRLVPGDDAHRVRRSPTSAFPTWTWPARSGPGGST